MENTTISEPDLQKYYNSFGDIYELVWNEQIHTGYFKNKDITLSDAVIEMNCYLAKISGLATGKKLLNIGCGRGGTDRFLAKELNLNIEGIDISEKQIRIARGKALAENISNKCRYAVASALDIPFADNTFDYILCQESFFHIQDKLRAVSEFQRVLKNKGLVVLEDTLLLKKIADEEINNVFRGRLKATLIIPDDYSDLFECAGFKLKIRVNVSSHLAQTYHKIVEFIEKNRDILMHKTPTAYKKMVNTNFGFDVSEKFVLQGKLGCMIFVFQKS